MSPVFNTRVTVEIDSIMRDVLVIYWSMDSVKAEPIVSAIDRSLTTDLEPDHILIIMRATSFDNARAAFAGSAKFDQVLARLKGPCVVTLMGFGVDGAKQEEIVLLPTGGSTGIDAASIKRASLTAIFRARNGFIESTPNYHFENPSKKHTDRFIRLSNILSAQAEISFIAFCTLPFVPIDCEAAYLDTPALYPIVAAINDHRRLLLPGHPPIVADNFGSYEGARRYPFTDQDKSVVLISASSSGGLGEMLVQTQRFAPDRIIHILFLWGRPFGDETLPQGTLAVADLAYEDATNPLGIKDLPADHSKGTCALCDMGSTAIPLHGDQFDLPGPRLEPLLIKQSDAPDKLSQTIAMFSATQALGVGLGRRDSRMPRLLNVDVPKLLGSPKFADTLNYVIARSTPNQTGHILVLDKHSQPIADLIKANLEETGQAPKLLSRDQIDQIPDGIATPVIVVAAVIESGRALLDISRDLRQRCRAAPLVYIVGVNKTTGSQRREMLRDNLSMAGARTRHEVVFVSSLVLPPSSDDHAWTAELRTFERARQIQVLTDEQEAIISDRIARLSNAERPLIDDLFLPSVAQSKLKVQSGFVFAREEAVKKYTQADVFFTIAAVLQRLRANADKVGAQRALRADWFQQTALAPENFGRFNDGVIQASLLRAAQPSELNYASRPELSQEMGRIIARIVASADESRGEAAGEFLLAIASGRLSLDRDHVADILKHVPDRPLLNFLKQAIESGSAVTPHPPSLTPQ